MADLLTYDDAIEAVSPGVSPSGELTNMALVQRYIDATTPVIEELSQPVTQLDRTRACDGGRSAILLPWPFTAVTSVTESGTVVDPSGYVADGEAAIIYRASSLWAPGRRNIVATVTVGVTQVPGNQRLAAMMLFAHLWRTRNGPRPAFNQPGVETSLTPSGFAVPNAVVDLLQATPRLPGFA